MSRRRPTADGGSATEFYIDPGERRRVRGRPLRPQAALIAATQRPSPSAAFERTGRAVAAPVVGRRRHGRAAGTDVVRSMAERAGATITEVEGSHVIMISQPQAVTDVILEAVAGGRLARRGWA